MSVKVNTHHKQHADKIITTKLKLKGNRPSDRFLSYTIRFCVTNYVTEQIDCLDFAKESFLKA